MRLFFVHTIPCYNIKQHKPYDQSKQNPSKTETRPKPHLNQRKPKKKRGSPIVTSGLPRICVGYASGEPRVSLGPYPDKNQIISKMHQ